MGFDGRRRKIAAALALLLLSRPGLAQQSESPKFPAGVAIVKVDVVVRDQAGQPVTGLGREDFAVYEDGVLRPLLQFEAIAQGAGRQADPGSLLARRISTNVGRDPRYESPHFLIVFDGFRLSLRGARRALKASQEFLQKSAHLSDRVTLAATHGSQSWTGRARDLRDPEERARSVRALVSQPGPDRKAKPDPVLASLMSMAVAELAGQPTPNQFGAEVYTEALAASNLARKGLESTIEEATLSLLKQLIRATADDEGRKALLLFTEGSTVSPHDQRWRSLAELAARHRVTIYSFDARGQNSIDLGTETWSGMKPLPVPGNPAPEPTQITPDDRETWGQNLAAETGGFTVRNTENLAVEMNRAAAESRAYYLLGFEPRAASDGKFHPVSVQLTRKGFEVEARPGYYAGGPGAVPASPRAAPEQPLPIRVAAYVGGPAGDGSTSVRLVAEADPSALVLDTKGEVATATLETRISVARAGGLASTREQRSLLKLTPQLRELAVESWIPLARDLSLEPGEYEALVSVHDAGGGRTGSVLHAFEVPEPHSFRLTTPVITDQLRPDGSARELAHRRFASGAQLACRFEVLGFARDAAGQARIVESHSLATAAGAVVRNEPPTTVRADPQATLARGFGLDLSGLAEGEYVLRLSVRDEISGGSIEVEEPLLVSAAQDRAVR